MLIKRGSKNTFLNQIKLAYSNKLMFKSKFKLSWLKGMCGHEHVRCMHHLIVWIKGDLIYIVRWDLEDGVCTSEMEELQVKQRGSKNPYPLFTNA